MQRSKIKNRLSKPEENYSKSMTNEIASKIVENYFLILIFAISTRGTVVLVVLLSSHFSTALKIFHVRTHFN